MYRRRIIISFFILLLSFHIEAQKKKSNCDLTKASKNMLKIQQKNSIKDLDELFGLKSQIAEAKNDSTYIVYKYQFCDSSIKNTIFVVYFKNALSQVNKSFTSEKCYHKDLDNGFAAHKDWTYKEFKEIFGEEGDLTSIHWDVENGKEIQRSYSWRSCRSSTSYTVIYKDGKMDKVNQFPKKPDYSRPVNGKKR